MPHHGHAEPARVPSELALVRLRAGVVHPEPQVHGPRHGAAALRRHARQRLPRPGRRAVRPPPRGASPRAQRWARPGGPLVPLRRARRRRRGLRGARPRPGAPRRPRRRGGRHGVGRLRRHGRRALLRGGEGQRRPAGVPGRPVPDHRRRWPPQRRRVRDAPAQVRRGGRPRRRRPARGRPGQGAGQGRHGRRRLLGDPRRRWRQLRRRAVVAGQARPRPARRHGVQGARLRRPRRRGRAHQVADRRAGVPRRPLRQGARAGEGRRVPVPVPRHVRRAAAGDARPVPGARAQPHPLQGDDVAPVRALHLPGQRRRRGGHPQPDHVPGGRQQGHLRLRPGAPRRRRLDGDLQVAGEAQRGADDPGPLRRQDRQRGRVGHAVPTPRRRAVQHPVHELLAGGRRRRGGGDQVDQGHVRVHGAAREQEPQGGLLQLQGP